MRTRNKLKIYLVVFHVLLLVALGFPLFIPCSKCEMQKTPITMLSTVLILVLGVSLYRLLVNKLPGERHFKGSALWFPEKFTSPIKRSWFISSLFYFPCTGLVIFLLLDIFQGKIIPAGFWISELVLIFLGLLLDLRLGCTEFLIDETVLRRKSLFPWERDEIDLKDVIGFSEIGGRMPRLYLLHKNGVKIVALPLWRFDFSEVQNWAYRNLPPRV